MGSVHAIWMHEPPAGAQMPQLALQQYSPAPHVRVPQRTPAGASGTQPHTLGELSQRYPSMQSPMA
jgi:hypothetical protein